MGKASIGAGDRHLPQRGSIVTIGPSLAREVPTYA